MCVARRSRLVNHKIKFPLLTVGPSGAELPCRSFFESAVQARPTDQIWDESTAELRSHRDPWANKLADLLVGVSF
jgi:hypothetical protein